MHASKRLLLVLVIALMIALGMAGCTLGEDPAPPETEPTPVVWATRPGASAPTTAPTGAPDASATPLALPSSTPPPSLTPPPTSPTFRPITFQRRILVGPRLWLSFGIAWIGFGLKCPARLTSLSIPTWK